MKTPRRKKRTEPAWYWVEGLRKLHGVKVWFPLYCSKTEAGAQLIQRMCEAQEKGYREFRTVPDSEQKHRCSECTSNYLKRIKREGVRLWKCLNCGHVWERGQAEAFTKEVNASGEGSTSPSKARKRPQKGADTPKRKKKPSTKREVLVPEVVPAHKRRPKLS